MWEWSLIELSQTVYTKTEHIVGHELIQMIIVQYLHTLYIEMQFYDLVLVSSACLIRAVDFSVSMRQCPHNTCSSFKFLHFGQVM